MMVRRVIGMSHFIEIIDLAYFLVSALMVACGFGLYVMSAASEQI